MAPAHASFVLARDHPAFEGHFPGHPIAPAVVILAEVMAAMEASASAGRAYDISSAKFLRPVGPGVVLTVRHEELDSGQVRFEVASDDGVVATGTLAPR